MSLPPHLKAALDSRLEGVSRKALAVRAQAISEGYRSGAPSSRAIRDADDALAYAVARMPATYAAIASASKRLAELWPEFYPVSMLDVGAGPGTATFAAAEHWPSLETSTQIERHPAFRKLAGDLASDAAPSISLRSVTADLTTATLAIDPADLAIMSYALIELPESSVRSIVGRIFEAARGAVILVEPGTPAGFARIRMARDILIAEGGHILAPCPGDMSCPIAGTDWCHFSVRVARSRDHKLLKGADAPFEDERFTYVAVTKTQRPPSIAARIVAEPVRDRAAISLKLCTPDGLRNEIIPRADKADYKRAGKADWGDPW